MHAVCHFSSEVLKYDKLRIFIPNFYMAPKTNSFRDSKIHVGVYWEENANGIFAYK
jgi:hypothetical protein